MSASDLLHAHGVQVVRSPDGELKLLGLGSLPVGQARVVVDYARANKAAILAEMEAQAEHPKDRYARLCAGYWEDCTSCPSCDLSALYFCRKFRDQEGRWLQ